MEKQYVAQRIARIRLSKGISARKMSLELGQSTEYINQIENGRMMPSIEGLFNICDYLGVQPKEFFDEDIEYLVEYPGIVADLNRLDVAELAAVREIIRLLAAKK